MTTAIQPPPPILPPPPIQPGQLWSSMPGWGIATDLTPPELINSRQLTLLRKVLGVCLVALLLVCAGGYVLAARANSAASDKLATVQAQTVTLKSDATKYASVTKIQGTVTEVQTQIANLMSGDVDLVKLMALIRSSLPATMTINQESVTIVLAAVASAGTATGGGLDTSGLARIGNVTLAGTGRTLDDLAAFVDKLKVIPGFVEVMPTSNTAAGSGTTYSLSLGLTSSLISHRFDLSNTVTK